MSNKSKLQAAILSLALLVPATSTFAMTPHRTRRTTSYTRVHHRHHYSQTRGAIVGAVAGAVIDHRHPLTGAVVGAAAGGTVQAVRNHKQ
jgi:hypothetical protein